MSNFIAFRFCDNDFHVPLQEAIRYIAKHRTEELTLEAYREFAIRGTVAFHALRRIDNFSVKYGVEDIRPYIEKTLEVTEVKSLDKLENFEGYIFDKNLETVFYQGY